jgi:predicted transcriptional regulator
MKVLTNNRKTIFLEIANAKQITKSELCQYSISRGGNLSRIPHHLMGLESENYISMTKSTKNDCSFSITKKGQRMLSVLR